MEGGVFLLATDYRQLFIRSGIHRRGAESAEECGAQRGRGKRDQVARATLPVRLAGTPAKGQERQRSSRGGDQIPTRRAPGGFWGSGGHSSAAQPHRPPPKTAVAVLAGAKTNPMAQQNFNAADLGWRP